MQVNGHEPKSRGAVVPASDCEQQARDQPRGQRAAEKCKREKRKLLDGEQTDSESEEDLHLI